jgi:hypothetical protein
MALAMRLLELSYLLAAAFTLVAHAVWELRGGRRRDDGPADEGDGGGGGGGGGPPDDGRPPAPRPWNGPLGRRTATARRDRGPVRGGPARTARPARTTSAPPRRVRSAPRAASPGTAGRPPA